MGQAQSVRRGAGKGGTGPAGSGKPTGGRSQPQRGQRVREGHHPPLHEAEVGQAWRDGDWARGSEGGPDPPDPMALDLWKPATSYTTIEAAVD